MTDWLDPVYDSEGMAAADRFAIRERGIASLELMEAAGRGLAEAAGALATTGGSQVIQVVCGKGNNAGDGLVAARHLAEAGYETEVLLLWPADELSPDSAANYERLPALNIVEGAAAISRVGDGALIIDAMLGTGFEGEARSPVSNAIVRIKDSLCPVVCCDVPSGVNASSGEAGLAVSGDLTVTFHGLKTGHLLNPGKGLCGRVEVIDIGIPKDAPPGDAAGRINSAILDLPPRRGAASNKFTSGRVTVVGGSKGMTGAVSLAASAAVRSGAGYASVAVPADLEAIFEIKLTEVMSAGFGETPGRLESDATQGIREHCEKAAAVVLGSGIGRGAGVDQLVVDLASSIEAPMVIDADGLGALAGKVEALASRQAATVLTPHVGEMSRLIGRTSAEVGETRLASALELARRSGSLVVLKGDDTIITDGSRIAINDLPAPGLATAGTGDVLAGVLGALLARGMEAFEAACVAVYCHSRAGGIAAAKAGSAEGVIASDVIEAMPGAMVASAPGDRGFQ